MSYLAKTSSPALSLKSAAQNTGLVIDLANASDKALALFGASQKTRKDVRFILMLVAGAVFIACLIKAFSK